MSLLLLLMTSCKKTAPQETTAIVFLDQTETYFSKQVDIPSMLDFLYQKAGIETIEKAQENGLSVDFQLFSELYRSPHVGEVLLESKPFSYFNITRKRIEEQQQFHDDLVNKLQVLKASGDTTYKQSNIFEPLMKAINTLAQVDGNRVLVLYSDLIHNDSNYSIYTDGIAGLKDLQQQFPADFSKPITIYVISPLVDLKQSKWVKKSQQLWTAFFEDYPNIQLAFISNL